MWSEPDPLTHPCNFKLVNQYGETVELYDFEGDVIVLDFSTMWCRVCKTVADHVQNLHDTYSPLSIITILTEDTSGNEPTVDKLLDWSTEYGITTAPILAGNSEMTGTQPDQWNVNGIPCFFLIDKSFYVRIMQPGWNEETMIENIETLLAE
jgi:thiol-disulfide isomerase/thioredoxin